MPKAIVSPLRYPGSKSKVMKRISPYFIDHKEYREPFAGSGAIYFGKTKVNKNWLNDKDPYVFNFLTIMRDNPEELCQLVENNFPTIDLWKKIKQSNPILPIDIAFKFLFLNRTNFSGIINANPIGGLDQKSKYKIDCRWNPTSLCNRIRKCSNLLQDTKITSLDYKSLIEEDGTDVLLVLDPPYYKKGDKLYSVSMSATEHQELAILLKNCKHKFLLTIDDCPEVRELYSWANYLNQEEWFYSLTSTAETKGKELFISNFDISTKENELTHQFEILF